MGSATEEGGSGRQQRATVARLQSHTSDTSPFQLKSTNSAYSPKKGRNIRGGVERECGLRIASLPSSEQPRVPLVGTPRFRYSCSGGRAAARETVSRICG